MTGGVGVPIPKIIRDAHQVRRKLENWAAKPLLKREKKELLAEAGEVIEGLEKHAREEYSRGFADGKKVVVERIVGRVRDALDQPLTGG